MNISAITPLSHFPANMIDTSQEKDSDNNVSSSAVFYANVNLALWQTVPPVMLLMGYFGNVMTIVVMREMRASESTACLSVYFTALAVSDILLLTSSQLWYWPKFGFHTPLHYFNDFSCKILFYAFYVTSLTSAWFLVAMTCQRMTSVVLPHRVGVLCTVKRGKILTAVIAVLACAANINVFFLYHIQYEDDTYASCVSTDEYMANIARIVDLGLASVIPFFILTVSNTVLVSKAVQSLRLSGQMATKDERRSKAQSAKVSSMTTTLTFTSIAFLLLTLPTCIFDVYLELAGYYEREIEDETLDAQLTVVDTVFNFMWASNSAVNFYIYVLSGKKFREETKRKLCWLVSR